MKNRSYVSVQPIVEVDVAVAEAPEVKAPKASKPVVVETPVVEEPVVETPVVEEPVAQAEAAVEVQEEAPKAPRKKKTKEE